MASYAAAPVLQCGFIKATRNQPTGRSNRGASEAFVTDLGIRRYRTVFVSDVHLGTRGCQAEMLLDFIGKEIGGAFYDRGVHDAQQLVQQKAEDIVVSEGFEGLENDPVLSEEDDDSEDVIEFTHDGVKYYKDSNHNLYAFGCDLDDAELVGVWNEEKKCVEEAESSDQESSDQESSDQESSDEE